MKKFLSIFLLTAILMTTAVAGAGIPASAKGVEAYITVSGYDPNVDYMSRMMQALKDGGSYAMQVGAIYEKQRNLKIDSLKLKQEKTSYFTDYSNAKDILAAIEEARNPKPTYSQADLDLLSRVIYAEVGCTWIPDWVQRMVGSVVLNRVNSSYYPNTIREVIYQPGQYSPTWDGSINKTPDSRTIANAKYLLENGSVCPGNVIGQNSIITGSGVYKSYYDSILGTTVYFCYQ